MKIDDIFVEGRITQVAAQDIHMCCCNKVGITDPDSVIADWNRRSSNLWNCPPEQWDDTDDYVEHLASLVEQFMRDTLEQLP